jgi:hypothetical protein
VHDIFDRYYQRRTVQDAQKLAVLYFVLALGALFDVDVVPGAISEWVVMIQYRIWRPSVAFLELGTRLPLIPSPALVQCGVQYGCGGGVPWDRADAKTR